MHPHLKLGRAIALGCSLACALSFLAWLAWLRGQQRTCVEKQIPSIMGTETRLKAVVQVGDEQRAKRALDAAEAALRGVDARMSTWVGTTELSRFNASPPGQAVHLSGDTLSVLRTARALATETGGAFDATCRPILELWRRCEEQNREPTQGEIDAARSQTGWQHIQLHSEGAERLMAGASVDIGGIAKGFAVDRAVEAMEAEGVMGGLVQCGGDLRVFGLTDRCEPWTIRLPGPHDASQNARAEVLELAGGAISTSGDSRRYFTVRGRRRSHIVDPRSGRSVVDVPQVTVIAPSAVVSDGWSTALSVLGPDGLTILPTGVEARIWVRSGVGLQVISTPGFGQRRRRL